MAGPTTQLYIWNYVTDPTDAPLSSIDPPLGALVIDIATGSLYRKTTGYGDNSGFVNIGGATFDLSSPPPIGNVSPNSGSFTTVNGMSITGDGATLAITVDKIFTVLNTITLGGIDGSTLDIGSGTVLSNIAAATPIADGAIDTGATPIINTVGGIIVSVG